MWYVIEGYDGSEVLQARLRARPEHLARLQALQEQGRLLLAGPCPAVDSEDPGSSIRCSRRVPGPRPIPTWPPVST